MHLYKRLQILITLLKINRLLGPYASPFCQTVVTRFVRIALFLLVMDAERAVPLEIYEFVILFHKYNLLIRSGSAG